MQGEAEVNGGIWVQGGAGVERRLRVSDKGQDGAGELGGGCRRAEGVELEVGIPQGWGCLCSERCAGSARRPALGGRQERWTHGVEVGGSGG